jgi:hypothetical protein
VKDSCALLVLIICCTQTKIENCSTEIKRMVSPDLGLATVLENLSMNLHYCPIAMITG